MLTRSVFGHFESIFNGQFHWFIDNAPFLVNITYALYTPYNVITPF